MTAETWRAGAAIIRDPTGLHARPAVKLTKLARKFAAAVELRVEPDGAWVNAKSPNAVMKLRAPSGGALGVRAAGADAETALAAVLALVEADFDDALA